jgi:hypothetical protein
MTETEVKKAIWAWVKSHAKSARDAQNMVQLLKELRKHALQAEGRAALARQRGQ